MRKLGYWHYTYDKDINSVWYRKETDINKCLDFAQYFDSFDDLPWNKIEMITAFSERFPESKYVLLERDAHSWYDSLIRFRIAQGLLPSTKNAEDEISQYKDRLYKIEKMFANSDRLLKMNIFEGDGYDKLCPFLGKDTINEPFPKANVNRKIKAQSYMT